MEEIDYEIVFKHMILKAHNPEEAEQKAIQEVVNGNLEIKSIDEW